MKYSRFQQTLGKHLKQDTDETRINNTQNPENTEIEETKN